MTRIALCIILIICVTIIAFLGILKNRIDIGYREIRKLFPSSSIQFNRTPLNTIGLQSTAVVGDSLVRGCGASSPLNSLSGRIYTQLGGNVRTHGLIGLTMDNFSMLKPAIEKPAVEKPAIEKSQYDAIILSLGGNDILQYKPLRNVEQNIINICEYLKDKAKHIVWIFPGALMGKVPILKRPLSFLRKVISSRAQLVENILRTVISKYKNIHFVSYSDINIDPKTFFFQDGLHPSDKGYEQSAELVLDTLQKLQF